MILRFTPSDNWELGAGIAQHLIEVDSSGNVLRMLDVEARGRIVDAAPTETNLHGCVDHPPIDMNCDWSGNEFPEDQFEALWEQRTK